MNPTHNLSKELKASSFLNYNLNLIAMNYNTGLSLLLFKILIAQSNQSNNQLSRFSMLGIV